MIKRRRIGTPKGFSFPKVISEGQVEEGGRHLHRYGISRYPTSFPEVSNMANRRHVEMAIRNCIQSGRIPELYCNVKLSNCGAVQRAMGWSPGSHPDNALFILAVGPISQRRMTFGERTLTINAEHAKYNGEASPNDGEMIEFNIDYEGIEKIVGVSADVADI